MFAALALAFFATAAAQQRELGPAAPARFITGRKVALVIGNGAYAHAGRLAQAPADADLIDKKLRELGFEVDLRKDTDQSSMARAVADFKGRLAGAAVGFFYYAGHAVQVDGANYLVPVNADLTKREYVESDAYDVRKALRAMDEGGSRLNIVVLDSCRNNPWAKYWFSDIKAVSSARGLADMRAPSGFIVAFATGPDDVAADDGTYARSLAGAMGTKNLEIDKVFRTVHQDVVVASHDDQVPWYQAALGPEMFCPAGCDTGDTGGGPPPPPPSVLDRHGLTMMPIPATPAAGFAMGFPDDEEGRGSDETSHKVKIPRRYLLADKEVTQALYEEVMGKNPAATREQYWAGATHGKCSDWGVGGTLPVMCVDFVDVARFCNRLSELEGLTPAYGIAGDEVTWDREADGYRLPTEAEWEWAARAGGRHNRYAGTDDDSQVCRYANVANRSTKKKYSWLTWDVFECGDGYDGLAPVGTFLPNGWDLYDMTGNVWEWVWDWYYAYPSGTTTDSGGPPTGAKTKLDYGGGSTYEGSARVFRGGSWFFDPVFVRVAYRVRVEPGFRGNFLGFRLARSSP